MEQVEGRQAKRCRNGKPTCLFGESRTRQTAEETPVFLQLTASTLATERTRFTQIHSLKTRQFSPECPWVRVTDGWEEQGK